MARGISKWTQALAGDGAITVDAGDKKATISAGSVGNLAYLRRIFNVNPGDVVEVVVLAQNVSGAPKIILDYPATATPVQTTPIDGTDFVEYRAAWIVPRRAVSGNQVFVNIGIFNADSGEVIVYDPQVTVNGFDVDTNVIVESGSNATGSFVKYADGTMICRKLLTVTNCTTAWGSLFTSGLFGVGAMPATFVGDYEVYFTNEGAGGGSAWVYQAGRGSSTSFGVARGASLAGTFTVHALAVGRWL